MLGKKKGRKNSIKKYDNLKDMKLYSIILFKFSFLSYIIEGLLFLTYNKNENLPYNIKLIGFISINTFFNSITLLNTNWLFL